MSWPGPACPREAHGPRRGGPRGGARPRHSGRRRTSLFHLGVSGTKLGLRTWDCGGLALSEILIFTNLVGRDRYGEKMVPLIEDFDRVADANHPGLGLVHQVVAEEDLGRVMRVPSVEGQGPHGLDPALPCELVRGRHDAADARLRRPEDDVSDPEAPQAVLGEGLAAGDDEVGSEPVHGNGRAPGLGHAPVEVAEGGLAYDEERKCVGEGHGVARIRVVGPDRPVELGPYPYKPAGGREGRAQPRRGGFAAVLGPETLALPDADDGLRRPRVRVPPHPDLPEPLGAKREKGAVEERPDARHPRY